MNVMVTAERKRCMKEGKEKKECEHGSLPIWNEQWCSNKKKLYLCHVEKVLGKGP